MAVYFRIYGLIYDRTVDCGERRLDGAQASQQHAARIVYNVGEIMGQVIGPVADMYAVTAIIICAGQSISMSSVMSDMGTVLACITLSSPCRSLLSTVLIVL